jgi:hypothetical protein
MNFFHHGAPDCSYFAGALELDALRAAGFFAAFFGAALAVGFLALLFFFVFVAIRLINLRRYSGCWLVVTDCWLSGNQQPVTTNPR